MSTQTTDLCAKVLGGIKPVSQEFIDKRNADERAAKVSSLQSVWNAPARHAQTIANRSAKWDAAFQKASASVNAPMGGTVALIGSRRGTGKTQIGVELMKDAVVQLRPAFFTTAVEFFMRIKETYRKDSHQSEADVIACLCTPFLLVIDEIGKRGGSEWENTLLFELINRRYNACKSTVVIDNRTLKDFSETIGPSIVSRMNESGGIIECEWESFRA